MLVTIKLETGEEKTLYLDREQVRALEMEVEEVRKLILEEGLGEPECYTIASELRHCLKRGIKALK